MRTSQRSHTNISTRAPTVCFAIPDVFHPCLRLHTCSRFGEIARIVIQGLHKLGQPRSLFWVEDFPIGWTFFNCFFRRGRLFGAISLWLESCVDTEDAGRHLRRVLREFVYSRPWPSLMIFALSSSVVWNSCAFGCDGSQDECQFPRMRASMDSKIGYVSNYDNRGRKCTCLSRKANTHTTPPICTSAPIIQSQPARTKISSCVISLRSCLRRHQQQR